MTKTDVDVANIESFSGIRKWSPLKSGFKTAFTTLYWVIEIDIDC